MQFFPVPRTVALVLTVAVLGTLPDPAEATPQGEEPRPEVAEAAPAAAHPLSPTHRKFLEEVSALISEAEREAFLALEKDYQRSAFIEQFWRVRDPFPETAKNELEDSWEERLEIARDRYDSMEDTRARYLLLYGEPSDLVEVRCAELLRRMEVWAYRGAYGTGGGYHLVFYQRGGWHLWSPRDGFYPLLSDLVSTGSSNRELAQMIRTQCFRGDQLLLALERTLDLETSDSPVPDPGNEWLHTFLSTSTDLPAGAEPFPAELRVAYPGRHQSRTVLQAVVEVDAADVEPVDEELGSTLNLLIDGEVVRDGELFESFRYRFQFPSTPTGAADRKLPLAFERYLRPGKYTLVVRARDLGSGRFYREERPLTVPSLFGREPQPLTVPGDEAGEVAVATPPSGFPPGPADPLLQEANATLTSGDQTLRLLPPAPGLLTGVTRVEALVTGPDIERVRFLLNGRQVMSKRRPPFSVELQLGEAPKIHRLAAVAVGEDGRELARDELTLNAGPHRFAVRLVEPRQGGSYRTSLRARAEVEVPEGERLDRVEFFLNDTRLATLYQPPFVQPVVIPEGLDIAYVQAKAYLVDGNSTEDLVFVNAPEYLEELDIQFVELYTTVVDRRGRPVEGLEKSSFRVLEDGREQTIRRFERVDDIPIYAGVVVDTSASMSEELEAVVRGALGFFEQVITPKDRAAVVTFNDTYDLAVRFTNNPEVLAGGVAGVVAEGETNLYDALIYSLYYFSGVQGKRALVLLSDGEDVGSHYRFDDVLDYARRTGVSIYTIGLGLPASQKEIEIKLSRLAHETGGRPFLVDRVKELDGVYEKIEEELRSQYLLAYQSSQEEDDEDFREVQVEVLEPAGLEAKTIRGYYP